MGLSVVFSIISSVVVVYSWFYLRRRVVTKFLKSFNS